jgi:4-methyl-5(b-hydroxyethyl)-thiazole monophosphate biosynthesis
MKALIPLAAGFEEIEAITPADLLRRAGHEVILAGLKPGPVRAARGTVVVPDRLFSEVEPSSCSILIIPGGGPGTDRLRREAAVLKAIRDIYEASGIVGAICAGTLVLQDAGILRGRRVTSFPGVSGEIKEAAWLDQPVVTDGRIVTSQGPGTAVAFALALVEAADGKAAAAALAEEISFNRQDRR